MTSLSDGLEKIVRPLEWPDTPRRGQRVRSSGGLVSYTIAYYGGSDPSVPAIYRWGRASGPWSPAISTWNEAKAAAEADYRARIASALNLEPVLSEIKRIREALAPFAAVGETSLETTNTDREIICSPWDHRLTNGHFRRAFRALAPTTQDPTNDRK